MLLTFILYKLGLVTNKRTFFSHLFNKILAVHNFKINLVVGGI